MEVTEEQLLQRRRELALKVADLTAQLESQRQTVAKLGVVLGARKQNRADKERTKLSDIRDRLFQSERELSAFDEAHPGLELMDLFSTQERENEECQQQ